MMLTEEMAEVLRGLRDGGTLEQPRRTYDIHLTQAEGVRPWLGVMRVRVKVVARLSVDGFLTCDFADHKAVWTHHLTPAGLAALAAYEAGQAG